MRIGDWQFTPGFWPSLATLMFLSLFVTLGFWQLDRADQKTRRHDEFTKRQTERAMDLNDPGSVRMDKSELLWRQVQAGGRFAANVNILLDNQVVKGGAGYFVFTPFHVSNSNIWLLINRGWVPLGADRSVIPAIESPAEDVNIEGVINDVPATGLVLGGLSIEALSQTVYRTQRIDLQEVARLAGHGLQPYVLALAPASGYGFVREWQIPGSGKEKNLGYAFQWFAFTVTLLVVYLAVNVKRISNVHG